MVSVPVEMLREAIAIYIRHAYPDGNLPEAVSRRIALDFGRAVSELLELPAFERYAATAPADGMVYALRLGSVDYPHIKLEIRPYPSSVGFVFWVNTHDTLATKYVLPEDMARWRRVLARNRDLKQAVERAWAEKTLPTFTTAMRESLDRESRTGFGT